MPFLHPLGLLALLAVPAVLALHLFRRRFRERRVSALFLWSEAPEVAAAGRRRERLLRSPSLWCELAAALALGLAFAGPKGCAPEASAHLVVVLDDSASMSAVPPASGGGESLRDRALALVEERQDALGPAGRTTVVLTGARPRVLVGPAALGPEARAALAGWRPAAGRHDPAPAVALAWKIAGGAAVTFVTDRLEPERYPEEVEVVALGEPLPNAAVVRARRTPETGGERERVEATLAASGGEERAVAVELCADGETVGAETVALGPDGRREVSFLVPRTERVLELVVRSGGGALAIDDRAWLAPPPARTVALSATLDAASLAALGLGARSGGSPVERWLALVDDAVAAEPALAHAVLGAAPGAIAVLDVDCPGEERRDWIGPFLIEKRHPLLDGVTLDGVIWSAAPDAVLPGSPLVSAGNAPILTEERDGARRVFHANLDPARSTLARSPDWPILLANLAELARAELPGPAETNLAVGDALVWRAREEAAYVLRGPERVEGTGGTVRELRARDVLEVDDLERPGVWTLERGGRVLAHYALSFADPAESDLSVLSSGTRPSSVALAALEAGASPLQRALLLAALALAALDWWVLGRARVHAGPATAARATITARGLA